MAENLKRGDLVWRDGGVEQVWRVKGSAYAVPAGAWFGVGDATLIGNVRDGWKPHTGSERPAHVGADDRVEAVLARGSRSVKPSKARLLDWNHVSWCPQARIVAYRVVTRAAPITGQGERCGEAVDWSSVKVPDPSSYGILHDREAELRAVAAEMRDVADDDVVGRALRAWADRIDRPRPESA